VTILPAMIFRLLPLLILPLLLLTAAVAPARGEAITINAVGDVMLAGRWEAQIRSQGWQFPFSRVSHELKKGDLTIANLESPLARSGVEFSEKKYRFRGDPAIAAALKKNGIGLVTLANNHSMDFGGGALQETLEHLQQAGVAWVGAGKNLAEAREMALYTIKGKKIAFLGYSLTQPTEFFAGKERPGTAPGYEKYYREDIRRARQQADYVIVSFHWGTEGKQETQGYQRVAAHQAIDAGADVIIGHHPHVLRGIERYQRGIIFYSLGNFTFASKGNTAATSAMIRLQLDGDQRSAEILPLDVLHRRVGFQPSLLTGSAADKVIQQLNLLSRPLGTAIQQRSDGRYLVEF